MKLIKFSIIALMLTCSMQLAKAQVRVGVHLGYHQPYRRVVVRHYPAYYPRRAYYAHPVYYREGYRRDYYHRGFHGRPVYRGRFQDHGRRW